jgi:hypothetical protein
MISDRPESPGPSRDTLLNLKAMLPSMIKGLAKKKIVGKGVPCQIKRPRKVCTVCGLLYDHTMAKPTDDLEIKPAPCHSCQEALDAGQIALVCGDEYAFATDPKLADWKGTIVRISPYVMEAVKKEFAAGTVKRKFNGQQPENPA